MPDLIDPTSDRPVYRQIADHLRQAIRDGQYGEGDALPSEAAMAETYGVTRMTARQAIEVLKTEGLVRSEHGRGVFVRIRPKVHRLARNRFTKDWREREGGRGAYDVEMKQLGLEPAVELVEVGPVIPPPEIAERLRLQPEDQALIRRRQMYAAGQPMQLATSYVPWLFAGGTQMVDQDSGPGGIYSRLAEVGHRPARFTEEVATRMPTPEEARFLRLTDPQPVFNLFRTAFDEAGTPVEVCEHVMSGDRWLLAYEWAAD
jgi:GntR family transcriptional regulator